MSKVLFFSIPLAAAGVSTWHYHQQRRSNVDNQQFIAIDSTPTYIATKYPPTTCQHEAEEVSLPTNILRLQKGSLRCLQCNDRNQRRKAATSLAKETDLDDHELRYVAQQLDHQTALLLASWKTSDLRLLRAPPLPTRGLSAELRLRALIEALPAPSDECAAFVTALALRHLPPADWSAAPLSADSTDAAAPREWRTRRAPAQLVVKSCVEALLTHASDQTQLNVMFQSDLLRVLAVTHAERPRDADLTGLLGRLIGHVTSAVALHRSGFLGLLAAWSREQDVRVSLPAWRTLRNLILREKVLENDTDWSEKLPWAALVLDGWMWKLTELTERIRSKLQMPNQEDEEQDPAGQRQLHCLPDGIYVLHPQNVTEERRTQVDVVFVHGLLGGTCRTWRQHDAVKKLVGDVEECRKSEILLRRNAAEEKGMSDRLDEECTNDNTTPESGTKSIDNIKGSDVSRNYVISNASIVVKANNANRTSEPVNSETMPKLPLAHKNYEAAQSHTRSEGARCQESSTSSQQTVGTHCPTTPNCQQVPRYTQCWPKDWLPLDLSPLRVRVLSVDYDTSWTDWRPRCAVKRRMTLEERARDLRELLNKAGIGDRPIVWVTHSMGGLIVKQLLVEEEKQAGSAAQHMVIGDRGLADVNTGANRRLYYDGSDNELGSNNLSTPISADVGTHSPTASESSLLGATRGIVFYSCPHSGSKMASLSPPLRPLLLPSTELDSLRPDSAHLLTLADSFRSLCQRQHLACLSIAETRKQRFLGRDVMFVEPQSAAAGTGALVLADADHLTVCKPRHRSSEVYRTTVEFVKSVCGVK